MPKYIPNLIYIRAKKKKKNAESFMNLLLYVDPNKAHIFHFLAC